MTDPGEIRPAETPGSSADPVARPDRPLRIEAAYRVRFDEATPDGQLRPSACMGYLQDIAWRHSEALGFGRDWYRERQLAWVVRAIDLRVLGAMRDGETLTISTRVTGMRRVMARRESEIVGRAGRQVGWCRIDWAMTDGTKPTRVPDEFSAFGGGPFSPTRVDLAPPPGPVDRVGLSPRLRECDPMGHVNNGVYVDWLDEAVGLAGGAPDTVAVPRRYRLEYFRAATVGMGLQTAAWRDDGGWAFRLVDESGGDLVRGRLDP